MDYTSGFEIFVIRRLRLRKRLLKIVIEIRLVIVWFGVETVHIRFGVEARAPMLKGVEELVEAIKVTMCRMYFNDPATAPCNGN